MALSRVSLSSSKRRQGGSGWQTLPWAKSNCMTIIHNSTTGGSPSRRRRPACGCHASPLRIPQLTIIITTILIRAPGSPQCAPNYPPGLIRPVIRRHGACISSHAGITRISCHVHSPPMSRPALLYISCRGDPHPGPSHPESAARHLRRRRRKEWTRNLSSS
jgi:hypothetical protein